MASYFDALKDLRKAINAKRMAGEDGAAYLVQAAGVKMREWARSRGYDGFQANGLSAVVSDKQNALEGILIFVEGTFQGVTVTRETTFEERFRLGGEKLAEIEDLLGLSVRGAREGMRSLGAIGGLTRSGDGLSAIAGRELPPDVGGVIMSNFSGVSAAAPGAHLSAAMTRAGVDGGPGGRVGPGGRRKARKTRKHKKSHSRRRKPSQI